MDNGNHCDNSEESQESQDSNVLPMTILFDNLSTNSPPELTLYYEKERDQCSKIFETWPENDQTDFVHGLLTRMTRFQQSQINFYLSPMLQRDFISLLPKKGLDHVAEKILGYLDHQSLCNAELVCKQWHHVISEGMLWKKLIEHNVRTDYIWRELSKRRGWANYLFKYGYAEQKRPDHWFYRALYPQIIKDIKNIELNWREGKHTLHKINCRSEVSKGVYCLQYDDNQIISGLRDNTIKIWSRADLKCKRTLTGHSGSVLCLQFDENVIVSGSSDATVRIWDHKTGDILNTLVHHCEAVLHLRFCNGLMVTCSKDRSIAVWDMLSPVDIQLRRVLVGHRAAVNVVDFDEKYIVSASGDRTIKVWNTSNCDYVRTLLGHKRGIACLQYHDKLVVSGSSDNTIRLWNVELGTCLRVLGGHEELVRCIRFDKKRIVSGAYDGKIKVWDLEAALNPKTNEKTLCLKTLVQHTGRVFRLQFDQFQIVSSSHDDTILIFDFLDSEPGNFQLPGLKQGGHSNGNSSNGNPSSKNMLNGAELKNNSLSNGSTSTNGFGNLSPTSSKSNHKHTTSAPHTSTSRSQQESHHSHLMDSSTVANSFNFDHAFTTDDRAVKSETVSQIQLNSPTCSMNYANHLEEDQEMTNSNESPNDHHQDFRLSPVNSSNENHQVEEIMDTMNTHKIESLNKEFNSNSSLENGIGSSGCQGHLFGNLNLISQSNGSKQTKLSNITNQLNQSPYQAQHSFHQLGNSSNSTNQASPAYTHPGELSAINHNISSSNNSSNSLNATDMRGIPLF